MTDHDVAVMRWEDDGGRCSPDPAAAPIPCPPPLRAALERMSGVADGEDYLLIAHSHCHLDYIRKFMEATGEHRRRESETALIPVAIDPGGTPPRPHD